MKAVIWIGGSQKDLRNLPKAVRQEVGFAIHMAQVGAKAIHATPMLGFNATVLEMVTNHHGNTFRAVYTVKLANAVYVLHVFQKKSKKGVATPKPDMDIIRQRLPEALTDHKEHIEIKKEQLNERGTRRQS